MFWLLISIIVFVLAYSGYKVRGMALIKIRIFTKIILKFTKNASLWQFFVLFIRGLRKE